MPRKEYSSELMVDPQGNYQNVTDLLEKRAAKAPQHVAFEVPVRDAAGKISGWDSVTTAEFREQVRATARGLIREGVQSGQTLAVLSPTRYEWAVIDNAAMYAGAVVVPIYDSSSSHQIEMIVKDAKIRWAVGGTSELCHALQTAFERVWGGQTDSTNPPGAQTKPHTPTESATSPAEHTATVWCMQEHPEFESLAQLGEKGAAVSEETLEARRTQATLDDPATVVYTSGTTAQPKGVIITHRNFTGQVLNVAASYHEVVKEEGNTIIFLPLAHVLARGLQMICLGEGMRIAHLSDPKELISQLGLVRPTFMVVVPRVLEKIRDAVGQKAESARLGAIWRFAIKTAMEYGKVMEEQDDGKQVRPSAVLRAQKALCDRLFYRKIRALMGNQVEWLLSGGAPLNAEISLLFRGMGLPVIEGYGLTETTAPLCGNLPGFIRSGTVGIPLPGASVRIADNGEVLARGIGVFAGYRNAELNAVAFDEDGFFRTGDLGELDSRGRLTLKGRLKDEVITAAGKSVSPFAWENEMEKNSLISHAVMVGDGRKFLTALIVLDADAAAQLSEAEQQQRVKELVEQANSWVAHSEQAKKYAIVHADLEDPELVTPTQKLKRAAFVKRWESEITAMYA